MLPHIATERAIGLAVLGLVDLGLVLFGVLPEGFGAALPIAPLDRALQELEERHELRLEVAPHLVIRFRPALASPRPLPLPALRLGSLGAFLEPDELGREAALFLALAFGVLDFVRALVARVLPL